MLGIPLQWIHRHPNFLGSNQQQGRNFNLVTVKYGCGTRGAAPASNAVGRGDVRGTPLPTRSAASCHVVFVFFKLTRANAAPTRADLSQIGPTWAVSAENRQNGRFRPKFKKKKGAKHIV